jgi:hypothetical protein
VEKREKGKRKREKGKKGKKGQNNKSGMAMRQRKDIIIISSEWQVHAHLESMMPSALARCSREGKESKTKSLVGRGACRRKGNKGEATRKSRRC